VVGGYGQFNMNPRKKHLSFT